MAEYSEPILRVDRVRKSFGDFEALKGVSVEIRTSEVMAIVGPSGSGKSTLLRTVNMLEEIDDGAIYFRGEMLGLRQAGRGYVSVSEGAKARQRQGFGMVFQSFNLFPHLTALENLVMPQMQVQRAKKDDAVKTAQARLTEVGLWSKRDSYPGELSGGQQQRVAIARALCMDPEIMLFDEPTSALDPELVGEVLDVMLGIASRGTTMMIVTHEMEFARRVATQMVFMDHGEIVERGTPDELMHAPKTERAQRFFSVVMK